MDFEFSKNSQGKPCLKVNLRDYQLISNPLLNKGMAFTDQERKEFDLLGLLPPEVADLALQRQRSYEACKSKPTDLEKYIYLRDLQDSSEVLFYSLLTEHIEDLMPIVYTPTVGLGCERFSHLYRRPRGLYIAYPYRDQMDAILSHQRFNNVQAIVVSDGERILGLGDQGAGGMGIPIGKLALYVACAGIHPAATLPILLDTGTNNIDRQKDPLYIGWRHERIRGKDYDDFIDTFVTAIKKRFPNVLLQWEDFAQMNANPIIQRYRDQLCTFNDDIQGTAAVATGSLLAAMHVTGVPLHDQRIVVAGGGSAGCGISNLIKQAMMAEGLSEKEASSKFFLIDRPGLLVEGMNVLPFQKPFCQPASAVSHWKLTQPNMITLADAIRNVHPTLLIGVSGQPGLFTEELVSEMAQHVTRPIIFPLSNPTSRAEATPGDIMRWTKNKALVSTGSPFPDITKNGKPFRVDQTNNCYIFPGMGLGIIAVKAKRVSDRMFMVSAKALAEMSPSRNNPDANLLPPLTDIRKVALHIACACAKEAIASGLSDFDPKANVEEHIKNFVWYPEYLPYTR